MLAKEKGRDHDSTTNLLRLSCSVRIDRLIVQADQIFVPKQVAASILCLSVASLLLCRFTPHPLSCISPAPLSLSQPCSPPPNSCDGHTSRQSGRRSRARSSRESRLAQRRKQRRQPRRPQRSSCRTRRHSNRHRDWKERNCRRQLVRARESKADGIWVAPCLCRS